jgi:hypothetical protein
MDKQIKVINYKKVTGARQVRQAHNAQYLRNRMKKILPIALF